MDNVKINIRIKTLHVEMLLYGFSDFVYSF
jgi:hypothetical protein